MKKVLVTFVEAGMGHIVTAQAIANALGELKDENVELVAKDIFHENEKLQKYENFLISEVKKASINPTYSRAQLWSMHLFGAQNTLKFVCSVIYGKTVRRYVEELKKINPDVIVDTHYFTSYCAIYYRDHFNPNCKVITYDPDNNVHGWWSRKVDKFIVNNELAYKQALKKKFTQDQLKQVYFVARHGVEEIAESQEFYRDKFGIARDKFTVMLADGIYAKAKLESFVMELVKTNKPVTVVAITGKNTQLYDKLTQLKSKLPSHITLLPCKLVENVYELYSACDLFITKAGPNSVLDSAFMQVPVVINYWANSIEKATMELFVEDLGCGVVIKNKVKARKFVEQCIDDKTLLDKYIESEKKLDKTKNGAVDVASFVLEQLNL